MFEELESQIHSVELLLWNNPTMSYSEVSESLGLSDTIARARLKEARKRLDIESRAARRITENCVPVVHVCDMCGDRISINYLPLIKAKRVIEWWKTAHDGRCEGKVSQ